MNKKQRKRTPQQAKFHVKKGDLVVVTTGKLRHESDEKRRGKVLEVLRDKNRVIIEGVNLTKRAVRRSQDNPQGGIVERESSVHVSNVMLASDYDERRGNAEKAAKK